MRTMCCFMLLPADRRSRCGRPRRGSPPRESPPSSLQEEFHLHTGELDDIVILERSRRGPDLLAVYRRPGRAFNVRDEIALWTARQYRHLESGLAGGR